MFNLVSKFCFLINVSKLVFGFCGLFGVGLDFWLIFYLLR